MLHCNSALIPARVADENKPQVIEKQISYLELVLNNYPWHGHCNSPIKTYGQWRPDESRAKADLKDKGVHPSCQLAAWV